MVQVCVCVWGCSFQSAEDAWASTPAFAVNDNIGGPWLLKKWATKGRCSAGAAQLLEWCLGEVVQGKTLAAELGRCATVGARLCHSLATFCYGCGMLQQSGRAM